MENIKVFQHILVPIDFGRASNHALTVAMQLSKVLKARLTLLHVVQIPLMTGPDTGIGVAHIWTTCSYKRGNHWHNTHNAYRPRGLIVKPLSSSRRHFSILSTTPPHNKWI